MKVSEIMTKKPSTCRPDSNVAEVAGQMWTADCGFIPVTNEQGDPIGVVTDRDICMAVSTRNRPAAALVAREVMSAEPFTCSAEDDVRTALQTMRARRVRRLPVLTRNGELVGVVSLGDIVLRARADDIVEKDFLETFAAICEHKATPASV